jgi:hypothetical protein
VGLDDLFGVDPNEFVALRDRLVRELRAEGDRDAAGEVKSLRRPSIPIWAVNQVARTNPDVIRQLVDVAATTRRVQAEVMNGADPSELRAALATLRETTERVVEAADAIIEGSGRSSASYERELADTLNMVASHDELAQPLRDGRLVNAPAAADVGEDVFAGLPEPTGKQASKKGTATSHAESDARRAADERDLDEAKERLSVAKDAHREAEIAADRARRSLESAQRAVEQTERARRDAEGALKRVETRIERRTR